MLVASTYPIDVVAAQQWLDKNQSRNLQGEALEKAVEQEYWDPSVQAMVSIPDALKKLAENIQWTADLGDAFLAQQAEVMAPCNACAPRPRTAASRVDRAAEGRDAGRRRQDGHRGSTHEPRGRLHPELQPVGHLGAALLPLPADVLPPLLRRRMARLRRRHRDRDRHLGGMGLRLRLGRQQQHQHQPQQQLHQPLRPEQRQPGQRQPRQQQWQHNPQQRGGAPYKDRATAQKYGGTARGDASARQTQARQNQSFDRSRSGGATSGGSFDRSRSGSGGNDLGSRNFSSPSSSGRSSSAFGGSYSGSQARSSSSRGSSSMGGMRGGGGGGRRR